MHRIYINRTNNCILKCKAMVRERAKQTSDSPTKLFKEIFLTRKDKISIHTRGKYSSNGSELGRIWNIDFDMFTI